MKEQECGGNPHFHEIEASSACRGGFLLLGILMSLLGVAAISFSTFVTMFSVFFVGLALVCGGVAQTIHAFWARKWSGVFVSLLVGILYFVTGLLCVSSPEMGAVSITLLIAALCLTGGLFRMISSLFLRFSHWGMVFFNGIVTFLLGLCILSGWPLSGLWVIGLFIGIDILLAGLSWIFLALSVRRQMQ